MAGVGDGFTHRREPLRGPREVCPLLEATNGPQPAEPGTPAAAGGHQAPGDPRIAHSGPGKEKHHSVMSRSETTELSLSGNVFISFLWSFYS